MFLLLLSVLGVSLSLKVSLKRDCTIDEAMNELGSNKCRNDLECNGDRICSEHGWCQGESHCPDKVCFIDEALNARGPNRCTADTHCNGDRHCSYRGWCHGKANCEDEERDCTVDEALSLLGPNRCSADEQCNGDRTCSHGWCKGVSNCH